MEGELKHWATKDFQERFSKEWIAAVRRLRTSGVDLAGIQLSGYYAVGKRIPSSPPEEPEEPVWV